MTIAYVIVLAVAVLLLHNTLMYGAGPWGIVATLQGLVPGREWVGNLLFMGIILTEVAVIFFSILKLC